jgi:tetratricopeptide (TPR) repeat protein
MEQAEAQRLLGKAYIGLGRVAEGIENLQDALALFRRINSLYDVVNLLLDLSQAFTIQGRSDEAIACLTKALTLGRRLGAPVQLASILNNLGCLRYLRGQYADALALFEEGLAIARRGGEPRGQACIAIGLADLYRDAGGYAQAELMYDASWQIIQDREPGLAVYILAERANMYRWQGDCPLAGFQYRRHQQYPRLGTGSKNREKSIPQHR